MLCVVLCTVCVGFVLDSICNYNVLQFVLRCVWFCVQGVGVCWPVFGIIMDCSLFCVLCGAVYSECLVELDCIWNYNILQFVLCILCCCVK